MKKYEFTDETKVVDGRTLYRIRALTAFEDVDTGDIGGWIEKESNLSHSGNAWVYNNACVYDNAEVFENAQIYNEACIFDNAKVYGNAKVCGNGWVRDNAKVYGKSNVYPNAIVSADAEIYKQTHVVVIGAIGSRFDFTTFYRNKNGGIHVKCGCFNGCIEDFEEKVKKKHGKNKHAFIYSLAIQLAKAQII